MSKYRYMTSILELFGECTRVGKMYDVCNFFHKVYNVHAYIVLHPGNLYTASNVYIADIVCIRCNVYRVRRVYTVGSVCIVYSVYSAYSIVSNVQPTMTITTCTMCTVAMR